MYMCPGRSPHEGCMCNLSQTCKRVPMSVFIKCTWDSVRYVCAWWVIFAGCMCDRVQVHIQCKLIARDVTEMTRFCEDAGGRYPQSGPPEVETVSPRLLKR
ncbi:hypothetical protein NDU88_000159 [Pleurodeles waltl]|uniref:Uncharacterized protein n=1 Tax=Pleurodeles waltl TaxID=8319 RepID=A0AAV7L7Q9_PLEWA|nr:hypothetical protein NDU88_000159 [Pleurodeles waltl]